MSDKPTIKAEALSGVSLKKAETKVKNSLPTAEDIAKERAAQ